MDKLDDIKEFVIERFFESLPEGLYYHNLEHTLDVCDAVERIGKAEGLSGREIEMLRAAAMFHDTGFVDTYDNNECLGAEYAGEYLEKYGYQPEEIEKIKGAILATNLRIPPKDKFEMVLCDADLDYLGRDDFEFRSNLLFEELVLRGKIKSKEEWDKLQLSFLAGPHYYTEYSLKTRAPQVAEKLKEISSEK